MIYRLISYMDAKKNCQVVEASEVFNFKLAYEKFEYRRKKGEIPYTGTQWLCFLKFLETQGVKMLASKLVMIE